MTSMSVDAATLTRFAGQPAFSWMASLRPIRIWSQVKVGKKCCGQRLAPIPITVIQDVVRGAAFAADLIQLKQRMKVDKLIINIQGYRTSV